MIIKQQAKSEAKMPQCKNERVITKLFLACVVSVTQRKNDCSGIVRKWVGTIAQEAAFTVSSNSTLRSQEEWRFSFNRESFALLVRLNASPSRTHGTQSDSHSILSCELQNYMGIRRGIALQIWGVYNIVEYPRRFQG